MATSPVWTCRTKDKDHPLVLPALADGNYPPLEHPRPPCLCVFFTLPASVPVMPKALHSAHSRSPSLVLLQWLGPLGTSAPYSSPWALLAGWSPRTTPFLLPSFLPYCPQGRKAPHHLCGTLGLPPPKRLLFWVLNPAGMGSGLQPHSLVTSCTSMLS